MRSKRTFKLTFTTNLAQPPNALRSEYFARYGVRHNVSRFINSVNINVYINSLNINDVNRDDRRKFMTIKFNEFIILSMKFAPHKLTSFTIHFEPNHNV
ncbi:MAG: hypothetical protein ACTS4T_01280 [Candidatus Hodgkinia cicadicola]